MKYHTIYLIENNINKKKYIGKHSTNNLQDKYFGGGTYLKSAIKKYGRENFKKKILELCENPEIINEKEIFWISELNTKSPYGYNLTNGGDGGNIFQKGIPKCEEHRRKMKEAWIDRRKIPISKETRQKISEAGTGEKRSKECKDKIGKANSRRIWKDSSKEKIRKSRIGTNHSLETLAKIGKKYKCKYCNAEMNAGNLARYHNENCKLKKN